MRCAPSRRRCAAPGRASPTPTSQYPVDTTEVVIARDDVWIYESYSNIDGDLLLADVTASLWGTGGN